MFNNVFDIMNSRNLNASGYKPSIQKENSDILPEFLVKAEKYIRSLKI